MRGTVRMRGSGSGSEQMRRWWRTQRGEKEEQRAGLGCRVRGRV